MSGARAGLKPAELLQLNIGQVQAVLEGYADRLMDEHINALWSGYYSAYYQSKHPKKPQQLIQDILRACSGATSKKQTNVDMDAELEHFAAMEAKFATARMRGEKFG